MVVVLSVVMLATLFTAVDRPLAASAANASDFQAGYIISDEKFYDNDAMTESQIQSFLNSKSSVLRNYKNTVASRAAAISDTTGNVRCKTFTGGTNLTAARIIYRAQAACGISAKVLLVTLQKEQALITSGSATKRALDRAMGMACSDTAPCAEWALGFGNQVYNGALQLNTYKASRFARQPGTHAIQWSPSCGSRNVNIRNYATAALYNYTPYQPNAKSLAAYPGAVSPYDACASYGNRNFWFLYNAWFGSPTEVVPKDVVVTRIGGADRYAVAAGVSKANFGSGVPVAYVTTGVVFSDALSAGPAAAKGDGPVLLVNGSTIPSSVTTELKRLAPAEIVVVGGTGSVSATAYNKLAALAPTISRVDGADRYEVSRGLALKVFEVDGASTAYLATGLTFADALSASAAAGSQGAPVILVRGTDKALDARTRDTLLRLGVTKVVIAGGPASVTPGIESSIKSMSGMTVERAGGSDRYQVSMLLNKNAFPSANTVYVASGVVFPDALAGSPVAGMTDSPLYVVPTNCVPTGVAEHIVNSGATRMVMLGGTGTLLSAVGQFKNC